MNLQLTSNKYKNLQRWVWQKRVDQQHNNKAIGVRTKPLFFVGIECSGIDYLAQLMKKSLVPIDIHDGPLDNLTPRLFFNKDRDSLALDYSKTLPDDHPLFHIYDLLTHQSIREFRKQQTSPRGQTKFCIIKETHALLGTEALLRTMKCKMLLLIDDPLSIVAQQIDLYGLDSTYLKREKNSVQQPEFLTRFLRKNYKPVRHAFHNARKKSDPRERVIIERVLTVALIQHMFRMLALRYPSLVTVVARHDISSTPERFQKVLTFLTDSSSQEVIDDFMEEVSFLTYSGDRRVWKNSWPLSSIATGGLSSNELSQGFKTLKTCGLYSV
ncbi:MAG: hypothetical protein RPU52_10965 [Candidatus Sedimenticola sp. (ex Thyasira tokunagai)]